MSHIELQAILRTEYRLIRIHKLGCIEV